MTRSIVVFASTYMNWKTTLLFNVDIGMGYLVLTRWSHEAMKWDNEALNVSSLRGYSFFSTFTLISITFLKSSSINALSALFFVEKIIT